MILYFILSTAVVLFLVVFQNFLRYFYESGNPLANLWQYRPLFPRLLYPRAKPDWILGSAWTRYGLPVIEATNGFLIPFTVVSFFYATLQAWVYIEGPKFAYPTIREMEQAKDQVHAMMNSLHFLGFSFRSDLMFASAILLLLGLIPAVARLRLTKTPLRVLKALRYGAWCMAMFSFFTFFGSRVGHITGLHPQSISLDASISRMKDRTYALYWNIENAVYDIAAQQLALDTAIERYFGEYAKLQSAQKTLKNEIERYKSDSARYLEFNWPPATSIIQHKDFLKTNVDVEDEFKAFLRNWIAYKNAHSVPPKPPVKDSPGTTPHPKGPVPGGLYQTWPGSEWPNEKIDPLSDLVLPSSQMPQKGKPVNNRPFVPESAHSRGITETDISAGENLVEELNLNLRYYFPTEKKRIYTKYIREIIRGMQHPLFSGFMSEMASTLANDLPLVELLVKPLYEKIIAKKLDQLVNRVFEQIVANEKSGQPATAKDILAEIKNTVNGQIEFSEDIVVLKNKATSVIDQAAQIKETTSEKVAIAEAAREKEARIRELAEIKEAARERLAREKREQENLKRREKIQPEAERYVRNLEKNSDWGKWRTEFFEYEQKGFFPRLGAVDRSIYHTAFVEWNEYLEAQAIKLYQNKPIDIEKIFFNYVRKNSKMRAAWAFVYFSYIPKYLQKQLGTSGEAICHYYILMGGSRREIEEKFRTDYEFKQYFNILCPH